MKLSLVLLVRFGLVLQEVFLFPQLDTTFEPQILYEGGIFNFGYVQIQSMGEEYDVNDGNDKVHLAPPIIHLSLHPNPSL